METRQLRSKELDSAMMSNVSLVDEYAKRVISDPSRVNRHEAVCLNYRVSTRGD